MAAGGWTWRTRGLLVVPVVGWGFNYLFVEVGLADSPPLWLAFLRASLGCLATTALLFALPREGRLDRRGRRDAMLLGVPNTALFFGLWFVAAERVPPGLAAVLIYTFPLWVALLSAPLLGHRLTGRHWAAVAVGFAGIALLSEAWDFFGRSVDPWSVAMLLGAAVCWALGTVLFQRRFGHRYAVEGSAWGLFGGSLALGALVLAFEPSVRPVATAPSLWFALGWLGVVGTALAYAVWYTLLGRTRAATLSAYVVLVPVVALLASAAFFGERLGPFQLAGVALVLVSLYAIATAPPPADGGAREDGRRAAPAPSVRT